MRSGTGITGAAIGAAFVLVLSGCADTQNAVEVQPSASASAVASAAPSDAQRDRAPLGATGLPEYTLSLLGPGLYWDVKSSVSTAGNPFEGVRLNELGSDEVPNKNNRPEEGLDITFVGKANATAQPGTYFSTMTGGKGHSTRFGAVNDLNVPTPPVNMYFAACGDVYVLGGSSPMCVGVANQGLSYNFWLGGPEWTARTAADVCNDRLGVCLGYNAQGAQDNSIVVSGKGCKMDRNGNLSTATFGCVYPQSEQEIERLLSKNCKNQHECQLVGFLNGGADISNYYAGKITGSPGGSAFSNTKLCSVQSEAMNHGYQVAAVGSAGSPYMAVVLKSGESETLGGDTRIAGTVRVRWSSTGNCASPDGNAVYRVNWDPHTNDDKEVATQKCTTLAQPEVMRNGKPEKQECRIMFSRVKYAGYKFGEPPAWSTNDFMLGLSQYFLAVLADHFSVPAAGSADIASDIAMLYQIVTMPDNMLFTTNLITTVTE